MASIQQSFNQMLMSAQIGAGLYAQTPQAKARAELKAKERAAEKAGEKTTEAAAAAIRNEQNLDKSIFESPVGETIETFGAQEVQIREELLKADPSDKNYQAYLKAKQGMEALQRSKERHLQDKKIRRKLLEGTPEENRDFTYRKTKVKVMEEEKDGK